MKRRYDSSRRKRAAEQNRQAILEAAMRLHWDGVTAFEPLAVEAGCSVATVRKHFPTKEALFRDCTRTFGETLPMPDLEALSRIGDPYERLTRCVSELCRVHEAMFGYAWHSAYLREGSPVLDRVMAEYEGLADRIVEVMMSSSEPKAALVRGLVDFLTYRALRLSGSLEPDRVRDELIATLASLGVAGGRVDSTDSIAGFSTTEAE